MAATRVAVVGGSIAGCAVAIELRKVGCQVTVYERSQGELEGRGLGIGVATEAFADLVSTGLFDNDLRTRQTDERAWFVTDGSPTGRVAWRHPHSSRSTNWGLVWRMLRAKVPDEAYRQPVAVTSVRATTDGALIITEDGEDRYDVVIGADGYRSIIRQFIDPGTRPVYAGYALWRGDLAIDQLPEPVPEELSSALVTVGFPGGHAVFYLIPDPTSPRTRMNWAVYCAMPDRFQDPTWLPPGSIDHGLLADFEKLLTTLPPYWAEVARRTAPESLSLQPIYDHEATRYAAGRLLLAGDAGTLARPHTGSGVLKAMRDARCLGQVWRDHKTWPAAIATYDEQRMVEGNAFVEVGRRLGRAQVEETPPWASMSEEDFQAWFHAVIAGLDNPYKVSTKAEFNTTAC